MTDDRRREAALSATMARFPAVAERVHRVYGLRLPRHVAVFAALWASADAAERDGLDDLMVRPLGLTEYFGDGGLDLTGRDGLDERLHGRFRRDPAEFVPVMWGGSDGLHYGLWYDDPAELPSFVVHNYARDSAETWTEGCTTLLAELRHLVDRIAAERGVDDQADGGGHYGALGAALDWFAPADREAQAADGPPRWARVRRLFGAVSVFPVLPSEVGDPRLARSSERLDGFRAGGPQAAGWIAQAERELTEGRPAFALAVGGELHWIDRDEYRQQGRDLLIGAYRSLGRDALAEIAEVHAAHRDLPSVTILV